MSPRGASCLGCRPSCRCRFRSLNRNALFPRAGSAFDAAQGAAHVVGLSLNVRGVAADDRPLLAQGKGKGAT